MAAAMPSRRGLVDAVLTDDDAPKVPTDGLAALDADLRRAVRADDAAAFRAASDKLARLADTISIPGRNPALRRTFSRLAVDKHHARLRKLDRTEPRIDAAFRVTDTRLHHPHIASTRIALSSATGRLLDKLRTVLADPEHTLTHASPATALCAALWLSYPILNSPRADAHLLSAIPDAVREMVAHQWTGGLRWCPIYGTASAPATSPVLAALPVLDLVAHHSKTAVDTATATDEPRLLDAVFFPLQHGGTFGRISTHTRQHPYIYFAYDLDPAAKLPVDTLCLSTVGFEDLMRHSHFDSFSVPSHYIPVAFYVASSSPDDARRRSILDALPPIPTVRDFMDMLSNEAEDPSATQLPPITTDGKPHPWEESLLTAAFCPWMSPLVNAYATWALLDPATFAKAAWFHSIDARVRTSGEWAASVDATLRNPVFAQLAHTFQLPMATICLASPAVLCAQLSDRAHALVATILRNNRIPARLVDTLRVTVGPRAPTQKEDIIVTIHHDDPDGDGLVPAATVSPLRAAPKGAKGDMAALAIAGATLEHIRGIRRSMGDGTAD